MKGFGFNGLANVNIELTNRCNKKCWMCGRRKAENDYPELILNYGDMDFELVKIIASQLPPDIVVQLHNNGEGLLYRKFGEAAGLFSNQITNIVTNGKFLVEKADEVIDNLDTLAVSVFEDDPEADEQFEILKEFLSIKGNRRPYTNVRLNGDVDSGRYEDLVDLKIKRVLHAPHGKL
jgi:MoaA/NifB/PqqE/SkfB family radical SAM enzyme